MYYHVTSQPPKWTRLYTARFDTLRDNQNSRRLNLFTSLQLHYRSSQHDGDEQQQQLSQQRVAGVSYLNDGEQYRSQCRPTRSRQVQWRCRESSRLAAQWRSAATGILGEHSCCTLQAPSYVTYMHLFRVSLRPYSIQPFKPIHPTRTHQYDRPYHG